MVVVVMVVVAVAVMVVVVVVVVGHVSAVMEAVCRDWCQKLYWYQ